ncbi:peptide ABC transporter permease [Enterococcus sp. JM4C]|uniref:oligopeptide ABC transporter permease n=1 Tax=Candidatus Enterococcus huntleyi TaxID=1857217 RepID=UPI00137A64F2|nr:oligopeptide ABC transporter permease [Enterococcus sp. JM4C]KAF1297914.1 peptide ABC transporter permease [Enterococcus sp. JM4C]
MWKTIFRRILLMIPQLIILSMLVFILAKAMPGDPFSGLVTPNTDPNRIAELREQAGLNDPWPQQYVRWIGNAFQGDFGISYIKKMPVGNVIAGTAANTIWLAILTFLLTYLIAIPLGMLSGRYQNSILDRIVGVYNYISFAMPPFVLALLVLWAFGYQLQWFPTSGSGTIGLEPGTISYYIDKLQFIILPAITQALLSTAVIIQYLRTEVIDSKSQDYVRTARSKGVPINKIYSRHIFRNASLPVASILGYEITNLVGGAIYIETIFGYPGMGRLFIDSISGRDYSVITALVLLLGIATLVGTLLSDIIMSIVDPRIRIQ